MKKLFLVLLLTITVAMIAACDQSQNAQKESNVTDESYFDFDEKTGTITQYSSHLRNDTPKDVIIPSQIHGVAVTRLGPDSFSELNLTSVVIPNSVTNIENNAFNKNNLKSVIISGSVDSIGDFAFSDNKLTSVTISEGLTNIGICAFSSNELTSITIPNSVTNIGNGAFSSNKLTSVMLPKGLLNIGNGAFGSNQLTEVEITSNTTIVEEGNDSTFDLGVTIIGRDPAIVAEEARIKEEAEQKEEARKQAEAERYNTGITWEDIARDASGKMGSYVKFSGKIVQVINGTSGYNQYRMAVDGDYDRMLLLNIPKNKLTSNILEDDYITIEGKSRGNVSYTTVMGSQMTIPGVTVDSFYY